MGKEDRSAEGAYKAHADCWEAREFPTAGPAEGEKVSRQSAPCCGAQSHGWDHSGHALLSVQ